MALQIPPLEHFPPTSTYERADELISLCNDYMTKHFPFGTDADREWFIGTEAAIYPCKTIPFATSHEKMETLALLNAFYFFFDDLVDKGGMEFDKGAMLALLLPQDGSVPMPVESGKMAMVHISAELNGKLRADMTPTEYDRLACATEKYLRRVDIPALSVDPGYNTVEELLELRLGQVGADIIFIYIRYAMELSVTDEELMDPIVKRCQTLAGEAGILRNDESSYVKEVNEGSAQNNIIMKMQEWSDCTENDARCWALSALKEREAELHARCTQALDSLHSSADAKRFVAAIPNMVGGNTWYHHNSSRYAERRGRTMEPVVISPGAV